MKKKWEKMLFKCRCGRLMIGKKAGTTKSGKLPSTCALIIKQDEQCKNMPNKFKIQFGAVKRKSGCYWGRKMPNRDEIKVWAEPIAIIGDKEY